MGLDGAALAETVARFKARADEGPDPDVGRGARAYDHFYGDRSCGGGAVTLGAVREAPFFAVEIAADLLGTNGGLRTDGQARILGHDGAPIPGLLGAGNAIACPAGGIYAGAGGTHGPALTFGHIAGRTAAGGNGQGLALVLTSCWGGARGARPEATRVAAGGGFPTPYLLPQGGGIAISASSRRTRC